MWAEFVVGPVLFSALRGFSLGTPVFPSPQKPTFPNSNSIQISVDEKPLCGGATANSYSILFLLELITASLIFGFRVPLYGIVLIKT